MFQRELTPTLQKCISSFPVTVLTGPRQSGKTTLLRYLFPSYGYYSLENPETLLKVKADVKAFLNRHPQGMIIDEAQAMPEIFSYIQSIVDEEKRPGQFILSGSQNFLLIEKVSQTLAGRTALLELLPLSHKEYVSWSDMPELSIWETLYSGGYPRIFEQKLDQRIWYSSYIQTYLERDVRNLLNVKDLIKFRQFLSLCAGRHGQLLNMNELGNDAGISHTTVKEWLALLEASFITYRLAPHFNNFNKQVVKTPKLYFYDSGLVCQLLGIESANHLSQHVTRGAIFEGYIISEVMKWYLSHGLKAPLYFWRSRTGIEVDLLIDRAGSLTVLEIKSGQTLTTDMLKPLRQWQKVVPTSNCHLVYGGNENFRQGDIQVNSWLTQPEAIIESSFDD